VKETRDKRAYTLATIYMECQRKKIHKNREKSWLPGTRRTGMEVAANGY
jgi:hypothetical protein